MQNDAATPMDVGSNAVLGVGADVWVFGGHAALPTRGTVTEMLSEGGRPAWGLRVKTAQPLGPHADERGSIYGFHSVFLRPQQRERLIGRLMDAYDALSSAADELANDDDA